MAITMEAARRNKKMTQAQAAKALNISRNTLAGYESMRVIPRADMAKRIAALYGMKVDDIIFSPEDCA